MKRLLLVCLIMICSASWAEWEISDIGKDGIYYLHDKASIRRDANFSKMWTLTKYEKSQREEWGIFDDEWALIAYDCANEMSTVLAAKFYKKDGSLVFSTDSNTRSKWNYVNTGTLNYRHFVIACGKK
jgi:hypothetical protein